MSRALVPVISRLPMVLRQRIDAKERPATPRAPTEAQDFDLVRHETHLRNRSQVERFLPDILGRALARVWIDQTFRFRFETDPKGTLSDYGVHLPETISIDFVTEGTIRPQVVVYERIGPGTPRRRLLYLQLVMMAGK
ncbi:hypothetical protein [Paragemmobacter straminiformis]|nr:hypothetical protein [Gemmobacter straminiformis]